MSSEDSSDSGKWPISFPTKDNFARAAEQANNSLYKRRRAEGAPEWALWQLHVRLVNNAKLYESNDLQDQRDAVGDSLLAVHDYLTGRGFAPAAIVPILRPVAALVEREGNNLDKMFVERPRAGRPKSTMNDFERMGVLAAFAELWLQTHKDDTRKQIDKLKEAARKLRGPWFGEVTAANLKSSRDLVMQESKDHPAVREAARFSDTVVNVIGMFGPEKAWSVLVSMLNDAGPMHNAVTRIAKTPPV